MKFNFPKGQIQNRPGLRDNLALLEDYFLKSVLVETKILEPMIYISQHRFDETADGLTCRGFDLTITVDAVVFKVRYYLDRPEEFTVISPKTAGKSPQIRQLVDYLASVLGGQRIFLYAARSETYREIDLQTLVFKTTETVTPHPGLKWLVKGASAGEPASENLRLAHT
jgi:hypothetical protein